MVAGTKRVSSENGIGLALHKCKLHKLKQSYLEASRRKSWFTKSQDQDIDGEQAKNTLTAAWENDELSAWAVTGEQVLTFEGHLIAC